MHPMHLQDDNSKDIILGREKGSPVSKLMTMISQVSYQTTEDMIDPSHQW